MKIHQTMNKLRVGSAVGIFILVYSTVLFAEGPDVISPEVPTHVTLSSTDVNRLTCSEPIKDVIFSSEKGVETKFTGNDVFVKFKAKKRKGRIYYPAKPSELFVICGSNVYTILAQPKQIPSQTIRLYSPKKRQIRQNLEHFSGMPVEQKALMLIREGYHGKYPESYEIKNITIPVHILPGTEGKIVRRVEVEGEGMILLQINVTGTSHSPVRLEETDFIIPQFGKRLLAISIDHHVLMPGETTRVWIVRRRGEGKIS